MRKKVYFLVLFFLVIFLLSYAQEGAIGVEGIYSGKVIDPEKYLLGPGDILRVYIIRETNETMSFNLAVSPTGHVLVPLVGNIKVLNKTLADATQEIAKQLMRFYPRSNIIVDIINIKKVNIVITGEVVNPGAYRVLAISTLDDVIRVAGGLKSSASMRNIQIKRGDKVINIDYMRFLKYGDLEQNPYIEEGDFIYIPLIGKSVKIVGQVRNPGIYEIVAGDRIRDILLKAGGITEKASREKGQLERVENGKKVIYEFRVDNAVKGIEKDNLELEDGDTIYIPEQRRLVYVLGQVSNPAAYEYREGRKLTEYISMAGGLKDRADLERIAVVREIDGKTQVIPINMNEIVNKGRSDLDIEIRENDIIFVPEVFIKGWQDIVSIISGIFYVYTIVKPFVGW